MAIEDDIFAAFPGNDEHHHLARQAVLRVYHAAENAHAVLDRVAMWTAGILEDPPEGIFSQILAQTADEASTKLHTLADQLRRSASQLEALKTYWNRFGGGPGGV